MRGPRHLGLLLVTLQVGSTSLSAATSMITIEPTVLFERPHFRVTTPGATWFYDAAGGGFSKLIDPDGVDWIRFQPEPLGEFPASAAAGYRGMPNAVYEGVDGGAGHPGFDQCVTEFIAPNTLLSSSKSGRWEWEWTFFEDRAEFNLTRADPDRAWWFLYEGNPGGRFSPAKDLWGHDGGPPREERPTIGDQLSESFASVWFGHPDSPFRLVLRHADDTPLVSNLWWMGAEDDGRWPDAKDGMLVFGFGRGQGADGPLLRGPHRFTVQLIPIPESNP